MQALINTDIEVCVDRFRELITKEYDIADLHKTLDEISHSYTRYIITDPCICGADWTDAEICLLRDLIKLFRIDIK